MSREIKRHEKQVRREWEQRVKEREEYEIAEGYSLLATVQGAMQLHPSSKDVNGKQIRRSCAQTASHYAMIAWKNSTNIGQEKKKKQASTTHTSNRQLLIYSHNGDFKCPNMRACERGTSIPCLDFEQKGQKGCHTCAQWLVTLHTMDSSSD